MMLWTDGTTHVQALTRPGRLRLYRDRALVAEVSLPEWEDHGPLAVDPRQGRIYAGKPLVELSLEDLRRIETHDLSVPTLACLPDGRLVTVGSQVGIDDEVPVLCIGAAPGALRGEWEHALHLRAQRIDKVPQGVIEGEPRPELFGKDVLLSANEHGLAIADGRAGIVALLRPGETTFSRAWAYPASEETELLATPFAQGLVVTPRLGGRDSHVHLLLEDGGFAPIIQWGLGCHAAPVGPQYIFCLDERMVVVFRSDNLEEPITHREVTGRILAATSGGNRFVVGFLEGIHVIRPIGDGGLGVDTVLVEKYQDLVIRFPSEQSQEVENELLKLGKGGLAARYMADGPVEYVVGKVDPQQTESLKQRAMELGAMSAEVKAAEL